MKEFSHRLEEAAVRAGFTTADLTLWFDAAYQTMRWWRAGRHAPLAAQLPQLEERLKWLETACQKPSKLPVPLDVRQPQRRAYILRIRKAFEKKSRWECFGVGEFVDGEVARLHYSGHVLDGALVEILADHHGARQRVSATLGQEVVGIRACRHRVDADFWMPVTALRKVERK